MNRGPSRPALYSLKLPSQFGIAGQQEGVSQEVNDYLGLFCIGVDIPETMAMPNGPSSSTPFDGTDLFTGLAHPGSAAAVPDKATSSTVATP